MFYRETCSEVCLTETLFKIHMEQKHKKEKIPENDEMVCHMKCETGKCKDCNSSNTCKKCKQMFKDLNALKEHIKDKHPSTKPCRDGSNCQNKNKCRYNHEEEEVEAMETDKNDATVETMEFTESTQQQELKCNLCGNVFNTKRELSLHIRAEHKTFKPCTFFASNTCENGSDCRYNHIIPNADTHICFKCGKTETTKTDLMKHIKATHKAIPCHRFKDGNCRFSSTSCIFSHELASAPQSSVSSTPLMTPPDFPQAWQAKPPDQVQTVQTITEIITVVIKEMMPIIIEQVTQKMKKV